MRIELHYPPSEHQNIVVHVVLNYRNVGSLFVPPAAALHFQEILLRGINPTKDQVIALGCLHTPSLDDDPLESHMMQK